MIRAGVALQQKARSVVIIFHVPYPPAAKRRHNVKSWDISERYKASTFPYRARWKAVKVLALVKSSRPCGRILEMVARRALLRAGTDGVALFI